MGCAPGSLAGGGSRAVLCGPDGVEEEQTPRTDPVTGKARGVSSDQRASEEDSGASDGAVLISSSCPPMNSARRSR